MANDGDIDGYIHGQMSVLQASNVRDEDVGDHNTDIQVYKKIQKGIHRTSLLLFDIQSA